MTTRLYKHLDGMELKFIAGKLERDVAQRAIFYEMIWELTLDFAKFEAMANLYIPGYLSKPLNAIRPELAGSAYHYSYNYLFGAAGSIVDNQTLLALFSSPGYYMDQWSSGGGPVERRYDRPVFEMVGGNIQITSRQYFRLGAGDPPIEIGDLPFIWFEWALNLMRGETKASAVIPETVVVLMQAGETLVDVGGSHPLYKRTPYLDIDSLAFGPIFAKQILIA
jgi:hypothetical protein